MSESRDAYTTQVPLAYDGQSQIVISGGDYVAGHDPRTDAEIWHSGGLNPGKEWNYRVVETPIVIDGVVYATSLDAGSGEVLWRSERLAQGSVSASLVVADGKLYALNQNEVTTVLKASPEFEVLATNERDGGYTLSSLTIAEGRIYIRTETHLYCIGE